ncbi:MAG: Spy/CpxP family protein refolding chaperone [Alphaproteobacteria bacterium]
MKTVFLSFVCTMALVFTAQTAMCADSPAFKNPATHNEATTPTEPQPNFGVPPEDPMALSPEQAQKKKKEMDEKLASKLNLTPQQRDAADKIHEQARAKMDPLIEQMKELRRQMDEIRRQDMVEFEKILTPEQQEAFDKMKRERKLSGGEHKMKKRSVWKNHD